MIKLPVQKRFTLKNVVSENVNKPEEKKLTPEELSREAEKIQNIFKDVRETRKAWEKREEFEKLRNQEYFIRYDDIEYEQQLLNKFQTTLKF